MEPLGYWIYLKNGNLFQEYPDVEAPFLGVKESGRKFREKEIVELMAYGKLELAIIISYPLTPEEIEYRKKRPLKNSTSHTKMILQIIFSLQLFIRME